MADDTMPEKKLINCVSVNAAKMPTEKTLPADLSDSFRDKCRMQKNSSPLMEQQNQSGAISCGTQASMNVTTTTITTPQINNASLSSNAATTNANTPSQQQSAASATGVNKVTTKKATTTPQKLSAADYCFGKTIGEGSYSTVYLAKNIHSSKEFAIKVVEKALIIRMNMHKNVTREREVMHLLTNVPGFVNLSCTFQDPTYLYFVMTYAKNGDLLPHINKVGSFDLNCTRYYAAELVLALENMHSRGLIHRDLKPENILLDEKMHTLIADFGSAKNLATSEPPPATVNRPTTTTTTSTTTTTGRRRNSFVGTAQYVSPEVVQGQLATTASDLWALGCIVYQMIAGLPPFRAPNEYLIFQKILKLEMSFPDGFNAEAADLVKSLLQINPMERLGAQDPDYRYISIRALPFFKSICWETLRSETPPPIYPYLPGVQDDDEVTCSQFGIMYNLEPGFGVRQQTQLLGRELGTSNNEDDNKIETQQNGGGLNLTNNKNDDFEQRMKVQRDTNPWDKFAQGQLILKHGYVNKRKGLFSRKRMLLLTTGPCLIYIDPVRMVKKGEITWTVELRVEAKNFKVFFVHTPTRTYYLEDPEGFALVWCQAIKELWTEYYG